MHRFFTTPENITDEKLILRGSDVAHIRTVLRLKGGDRIQVLDGRGNCYTVILTTVGRDRIESTISLKEDAETKVLLFLSSMISADIFRDDLYTDNLNLFLLTFLSLLLILCVLFL